MGKQRHDPGVKKARRRQNVTARTKPNTNGMARRLVKSGQASIAVLGYSIPKASKRWKDESQ